MFGIGIWELMVILLVALIIFGPKRLPELGRALGRGLSEFRKASTELRDALDIDRPASKPEQPPAPTAEIKSLPYVSTNPAPEIIEIDGAKVNLPPNEQRRHLQG